MRVTTVRPSAPGVRLWSLTRPHLPQTTRLQPGIQALVAEGGRGPAGLVGWVPALPDSCISTSHLTRKEIPKSAKKTL